MLVPPTTDDWVGVCPDDLPVNLALAWATQPNCGGVVTFCGTVRDHSEGRPDVTGLEYEAYEEYVAPALRQVAETVRARWPMTGRIVLLHRVGALSLGEVAVIVIVATPHRSEAFSAAHFAIDAVKATAPIWKRETWAGGSEWVRCDHEEAVVLAGAGGVSPQ